MAQSAADRPCRIDRFDDGQDAWEMAHAPAPAALRPLATGYSDYAERTASFATRRELPGLRAVLIVNLGEPIGITDGGGTTIRLAAGEGFVAGLHDRPAYSMSQGSQRGVHVWLTAEGLHRLLGRAAGQSGNQALKLSDVLGQEAAWLGQRLLACTTREARFQVLDDALAARAGAAPTLRPDVAWALTAIRRDPGRQVADIAAEIGVSRKTLSARFQDQFGLTPKTAARVARFERVLQRIEAAAAPDWAALAAAAGYFDQSHMIRDFTGFTGLTPETYRSRLMPAHGGLPER